MERNGLESGKFRGKIVKAAWIDCGVKDCRSGWTFIGNTPSEAKKEIIKLGWHQHDEFGWICHKHSD